MDTERYGRKSLHKTGDHYAPKHHGMKNHVFNTEMNANLSMRGPMTFRGLGSQVEGCVLSVFYSGVDAHKEKVRKGDWPPPGHEDHAANKRRTSLQNKAPVAFMQGRGTRK